MADANADRFVQRLASRIGAYSADSVAMKKFMTRVGADISSRAKSNLTRQRVVDTGRLLNSMGFRVEDEAGREGIALYVGAFGVRYAAIHEFGMRYTPVMLRAMFASLNNRGVLGKRPGKNIMHSGVLPPRPYLVPAFREGTRNFAQQMRDFVRANA